MKKIISANYRDRDSKYRWLVRNQDQRPDQAVACMHLSTLGPVTFEKSDEERGFGCKMVAVTESEIVVLGVEPQKVETLEFDGYSFRDPYGKTVSRVDSLDLKADGTILAVLSK